MTVTLSSGTSWGSADIGRASRLRVADCASRGAWSWQMSYDNGGTEMASRQSAFAGGKPGEFVVQRTPHRGRSGRLTCG